MFLIHIFCIHNWKLSGKDRSLAENQEKGKESFLSNVKAEWLFLCSKDQQLDTKVLENDRKIMYSSNLMPNSFFFFNIICIFSMPIRWFLIQRWLNNKNAQFQPEMQGGIWKPESQEYWAEHLHKRTPRAAVFQRGRNIIPPQVLEKV